MTDIDGAWLDLESGQITDAPPETGVQLHAPGTPLGRDTKAMIEEARDRGTADMPRGRSARRRKTADAPPAEGVETPTEG